jgi:3-oxoacyl-[acyl-carrier-protein] synthase-3
MEAAVQPFLTNRHDRLVFPANFLPQLDFSLIDDLDQLAAVIGRDFEAKAPSGTDILRRVEAGDHYSTRYDLMRDVALNLFWANRFAMTMYEKRPTRWRDVPRHRDDVFLPVLTPWEDADRKIAAVQKGYSALPARWDGDAEDRIFGVLFDVLRNRRSDATELPAVEPTVAAALAQPDSLVLSLESYDRDYPVYSYPQILDCNEQAAELEALNRWAMVLHNQYPWERTQTRLTPVGELRDEDYVVVLHPRGQDVVDFLRRVSSGGTARRRSLRASSTVETRPPVRP